MRRPMRDRSRSGGAVLFALLLGVAAGALLFAPAKEQSPAQAEAPRLTRIESESVLPSETILPEITAAPASSQSCATVELSSPLITVSVGGEPTTMELEEYVKGVVAGEMPVSADPAALEAQAVAARTFAALHMAGRAKCRSGCTVCDDPGCCQAYLDEEALEKAWGSAYEENLSKIAQAVNSTEGLVAVYDGELINAVYHASSGPATESSEEVFACALPYLVSVDSLEGESEMITRQEFTAREVVDKLNAVYPEANMSLPLSPFDFDVWGRTSSGRVQLIRIGETVIPGSALRMALGLKSTAFEVKKEGSTVTFTCLGYGHGVGMSQIGAIEMAKHGASFGDILAHFYTGTGLARLTYPEQPEIHG